jgi:DNA polymerase
VSTGPQTTARPASERRDALKAVWAQAQTCTRCPQLAATRKKVVFGGGNADAELMFVGEAPGASEDEQGLPFVGHAGKVLERLLGEIGMSRDDVFIANTLKCRPPANRDPHPVEIANCRDYLFAQVELIEPSLICTLGNFATKLLRDDPTGISRIHGRAEPVMVGRRLVRLYPLYHPAAALRAGAVMEALRADFAAIPELLAQPGPRQPSDRASSSRPPSSRPPSSRPPTADPTRPQDRRRARAVEIEIPAMEAPAPEPVDQMGLF